MAADTKANRSVVRALAIFDCFISDKRSMTLQEIANRTGLSKATAFRIVQTLVTQGYLVRHETSYQLSFKFSRLAGQVQATASIRDAARATIVELGRRTKETVTLNARSQDERIVLDVVETPSPLMAIARAGDRISLRLGATSRVLLAYMDPQERAEHVPDDPFNGEDLPKIREDGFAVSRGQRAAGLMALAVPVFDHRGDVNHCIGLSGPSVRIEPLLDQLSLELIEAGKLVSSRFRNSLP